MSLIHHKIIHHSVKVGALLCVSAVVLVLASVAACGTYVIFYSNRIYPGVRIGSYDVGGLTNKQLIDLIENVNNRYAREGLEFKVAGVPQTVKISTVASGESAVELVKLDSGKLSAEAYKEGRTGSLLEQLSQPIILRLWPKNLHQPLVINEPVLRRQLENALSPLEIKGRDANVEKVTSGGVASVINEKPGYVFDYDEIESQITKAYENFSFNPINIRLREFNPSISEKEVRLILPDLPRVLSYGPITIIATNNMLDATSSWRLTSALLAGFVEVQKSDAGVYFSLSKDKVEQYIKDEIAIKVNNPAVDAKFTVEENKVKEFQASRNGLVVDEAATYLSIKSIFDQRSDQHRTPEATTTVAFTTQTPTVVTGSLNKLGIVEFIGAGTSTFKDSHTNRIKNIAHAVDRLNGTLIAPGEEFSAIKYAGPFTSKNGYLPEQIIKGKEIIDEVGGGMCQIGTTLFRMAMNSGLPITERHNHSLVVGYYLDPVNKNPGTDATLYEPILDLKFVNETGNYLLLQTSVDYKKQMLTFSLWGTNDGRSGSYTHPIVKKWIPAPKEIEYVAAKDPANPGKCQSAFNGAMASFVYTRMTPQGETIEQTFDSYYRPLPKICPTTTPLTGEPQFASDQLPR